MLKRNLGNESIRGYIRGGRIMPVYIGPRIQLWVGQEEGGGISIE